MLVHELSCDDHQPGAYELAEPQLEKAQWDCWKRIGRARRRTARFSSKRGYLMTVIGMVFRCVVLWTHEVHVFAVPRRRAWDFFLARDALVPTETPRSEFFFSGGRRTAVDVKVWKKESFLSSGAECHGCGLRDASNPWTRVIVCVVHCWQEEDWRAGPWINSRRYLRKSKDRSTVSTTHR